MENLSRILYKLVFAFAACVFPAQLWGVDPFAEAAHELAEKIAAVMESSEEAELTFQSLASLDEKEVAAARREIESELKARGIRPAGESRSAAKINVTLSENFQRHVWVAEIQKGQESRVVISAWPRMPESPVKDPLFMSIQARRIYEQDDPILDAEMRGDELLVLDVRRLALFKLKDGSWELANSAPLRTVQPLRDMRGRLAVSGDSVQVYLPGQSCSGKIKPSFDLNCSGESRWPLWAGGPAPAAAKNYFLMDNLPAFFSAAGVEDDGSELLAVAGIDGKTLLFDKTAREVGALEGWGNDFAAIDSGCEVRRQILVALPADPLQRGAIQAFEIQRRKAVATSSKIEFPGPITALWPDGGQSAAIAVSRDIKTGRYAAFYLSISCSR